MNVKMSVLVNSVEALRALNNKPLHAITAFRVGKITSAVDEQLKTFEHARQSTIKKYAKPAKKGQSSVPEESMEEFSKEMDEVMQQTIKLAPEKIKLSSLGDIEIEPKHLSQLDWMIEE